MNKRVLLHNDNGPRDLLSLKLLQLELEKMGCKVKICNLTNAYVMLRLFRPAIYICARADHPIAKLASKVCDVYILPGEGARQTKETMLAVFMGRGYSALQSVDWIKRCFLWSKKTENWLLETGLFSQDQLKVIGNPRLDVYRHLHHHELSREFTLGVAISATSTSYYGGDRNYADFYFNSIQKDWVYPILEKGRHYEDIVWRDHAILRRTIHFIKDFIGKNLGSVWIRPNPLENANDYKFLENLSSGDIIIKDGQLLPDFLSGIDVLITCWSTTGLEALLLGIPVISISGLIDQQHLFNHISKEASGFNTFVEFYHAPKSENELFEMIEAAKHGRLAPSPKSSEEVNKLLDDIYSWPTRFPVAQNIAKLVVKDLEAIKVAPLPNEWKSALPLKWGLNPRLYALALQLKTYLTMSLSPESRSHKYFLSNKDAKIDQLIRKIKK